MITISRKIILSILIIIFFIILYKRRNHEAKPSADDQFEGFNNETGVIERLVPNFVHYVIFGKTVIDFITFLSMVSAVKIQRPEKLFIHTDSDSDFGPLMKVLKNVIDSLNQTTLVVNQVERPSHVYGVALSSVWHASDITRLMVLQTYGGIYLDTDQLVFRSLDKFRHFEMAIGWPEGRFLGNQLIVAHKNARFLKRWLESYKNYKPRLWYYNAGEQPTTNILEKHPELVHRERELFGVRELHREIWSDVSWDDWREFYAIHLLSRHAPIHTTLTYANFELFKCPFRDMAHMLLYEVGPRVNFE